MDKNAPVEKRLKLLITIVNAKLFKRVALEKFKASNVKNANKAARLLESNPSTPAC